MKSSNIDIILLDNNSMKNLETESLPSDQTQSNEIISDSIEETGRT